MADTGQPDADPDHTTPDPTRMREQPALRTSNGAVWLIMTGIFVLVCAFPLTLLTIIDPRTSAPLAWVVFIVVVALYVAMIAVRVLVHDRVRRLRMMAVLMVALAAIALFGLLACAAIEGAAAAVA